VGFPASLKDLKITDTGKIPRWAVEAHKEQRLLSRSTRTLSVEDIQKIYEEAF
jgi:alcohol dehydrogenase class IV